MMSETTRVMPAFPGGKRKVLTMSYDDGAIHDRRLVEIFNRYGIRGTFHLNASRRDENHIDLSEVPTLYRGHEVATHSYTHPFLNLLPTPAAVREITEDRLALEEVTGTPVRGHSYPFGTFNRDILDILRLCGIRYARTVHATGSFNDLPADFLEWNPTCHHKDDRLMTLLLRFLDTEPSFDRVFCLYVWGHSYEFERDNNWELIEKFCKKASGHDSVWYATNIEIANYA